MDESARKQTNDLTIKPFFLVLVLAFSLFIFPYVVNGLTANITFNNLDGDLYLCDSPTSCEKFTVDYSLNSTNTYPNDQKGWNGYYNKNFNQQSNSDVYLLDASNSDYLTSLNVYVGHDSAYTTTNCFLGYLGTSFPYPQADAGNLYSRMNDTGLYIFWCSLTSGTGRHTGNFDIVLNDTYYWNNQNSKINLRYTYWDAEPSYNYNSVFFLQDNITKNCMIYQAGSTSPQRNLNFGFDFKKNSTRSFSLNGYDCISNGNASFNFNRIVVKTDLDTGTEWYLKNIDLINVSAQSDNYLPDFNVTFSNLCYNSSMAYNTIHTNVTTYDPEGDTLYYGKQVQINRNLNYSFDYQDEFTIAYAKNYPKNQYNDGSYCEIQEEYFLNSSKHNIVWLPFNVDNENKYMLGLTSTCSGDPEYIITLTNPVYNVNYYTEIYGLQTLNEYFNVSFYDYDFNVNARAMFKVYNTSQGNQIGIYDYNGTGFEKVGNYSIPVSTTPIWFLYNMWGNGTSNSLYSSSYTYSMTNLRNTTTAYIGLDVANGVIYQSEYNYAGIKPNIEWTIDSTDFEDFIDIDSKGNYQMYYYLTDIVHYPDEYVEKHYSKYVNDCYPDGVYSQQDINNFNPETEFDPLKATNKNLGQSMKEYLAVLDTNNIGSQVLWVLYFFLFIGLYLFFYFTARNTDMTMPIIFSSMIILFLSILAGYTILSISSAIIMVFGIAIPITASLVKGSDGSE